jgi:hypothetical protein
VELWAKEERAEKEKGQEEMMMIERIHKVDGATKHTMIQKRE